MRYQLVPQHFVKEHRVRWLISCYRRDGGRRSTGIDTVSAQDGSDSEWEDEGEELFDIDDNRREALSLDARRGRDDVGRRLSRDLEEGFKDDSEDEDDTIPDRRSRSVTR